MLLFLAASPITGGFVIPFICYICHGPFCLSQSLSSAVTRVPACSVYCSFPGTLIFGCGRRKRGPREARCFSVDPPVALWQPDVKIMTDGSRVQRHILNVSIDLLTGNTSGFRLIGCQSGPLLSPIVVGRRGGLPSWEQRLLAGSVLVHIWGRAEGSHSRTPCSLALLRGHGRKASFGRKGLCSL